MNRISETEYYKELAEVYKQNSRLLEEAAKCKEAAMGDKRYIASLEHTINDMRDPKHAQTLNDARRFLYDVLEPVFGDSRNARRRYIAIADRTEEERREGCEPDFANNISSWEEFVLLLLDVALTYADTSKDTHDEYYARMAARLGNKKIRALITLAVKLADLVEPTDESLIVQDDHTRWLVAKETPDIILFSLSAVFLGVEDKARQAFEATNKFRRGECPRAQAEKSWDILEGYLNQFQALHQAWQLKRLAAVETKD